MGTWAFPAGGLMIAVVSSMYLRMDVLINYCFFFLLLFSTVVFHALCSALLLPTLEGSGEFPFLEIVCYDIMFLPPLYAQIFVE